MNTLHFGFMAALVAGLLGSTHCLGMCGGIATLVGSGTGQPKFGRTLAFNTGRLGSYALAGALVGGLGWYVGAPVDSAAWGNLLRAAMGVLMIAIGLQVATGWGGLRRLERVGVPLWRHLSPLTRRLDPRHSGLQALAFGALWGWIPCGLVYSALLAALVSGGAAAGAGVMLAFGIGTLPAMLVLGLLGQRLRQILAGHTLQRAAGGLVITLGIWTVAGPWLVPGHAGHHHPETSVRPAAGRGMNLGGNFGNVMEASEIEHRHGAPIDGE
jgi:sulfite exporter TauE/SafE